jgi:hypothetical protein
MPVAYVMPVAYGIASETCSTCADLHRLRATSEAALCCAQNLYLAALRSADRASLADLEEELKQITAARTIIEYTIRAHRSRQHAHSPADALAA